MSKSKKVLTSRERLFCQLYALLGNPQEAAGCAGFPPDRCGRAAAQLLGRPDIRKQVDRCMKNRAYDLSDLALSGLVRLAFGSHVDGARLALADGEPSPEGMAGADLFCVAEIKRPKGGGCEVKFYDRLPVLQLLLHTAGEQESAAGPGGLLDALCKSPAPAAPDDPHEI